MREFTINKNDAGQRLDKFIQKTVKGIPTSLMYKSIRTKKIKVNRKRAELNQMLALGDTVQMFLNEDLFSEKITKNELVSVEAKINVVYEDENILICDKAPGILVHSGDGDGKESGKGDASERNTLIYHVQSYLAKKGEYDPQNENSFTPSLCNRIDRNTGGMVICAKNAEALRTVNERIKNNQISKFYLCATHGVPRKKEDTLTGFLRKDSTKNQVTVSKTPIPGGKNIITKYRVLRVAKGNALLEVELVTGRTHQIRAHLSYIGYPLLGDGKYGVNREERSKGYKYQALYAYRLAFDPTEEENELSYLEGKSFSIPLEDVWFLRDFPQNGEKTRGNGA